MSSQDRAALPSGRVALLFSDIEGSTALLSRLGAAYGELLDQHDRILRSAFAEFDGHEFSNEGDAFGAAFAAPESAVRAASTVQQQMAAESWPDGEQVRVRVGLHYGEPKVRGHDYWGEDVHFAARVCSAAHGGQVLMSAAMRSAAAEARAITLGHHGLKDFPTPREIFQLVPDGAEPERFPAPRTLSTFRANLPSIAAPLFGREEVLDDLEQLFAGGHRLVSLIGQGGVGKTRVAVALGERVARRHADGVAFVALASVGEHQVAEAVADATAAPLGGEVGGAVVEHLRRRDLLLVMDNCEHVTAAAAALITTLLADCPGVAVLATSQVPLDLTTEAVRRLEPLDVPEETSSTPEEANAAVTMFVERARARDPSFAVGEDDLRQVAEVCRLLDGLPLAIELASARVRTTGIGRLAAALRRDLDVLGDGAKDLPDRQRSLRAALSWTLSLLTEQEREVFAALGAFAESWSIEEAERQLAGELDEVATWDALTRLVDSSLVVLKGDGRLAMPERVRRHAVEILEAGGQEGRWRRRHAEVIAREFLELSLEVFVDCRRMLANLNDLLPEMQQALSWTKGSAPDLYRHVVGLSAPGLSQIGRLLVVAPDLPQLAPAADGIRDYDDAAISCALGLVHNMEWSTDSVAEVGLFDRAAAGFATYGDPREVVFALYWSAVASEIGASDVETALRSLRDLRTAAAEIDDPRWIAEAARAEAASLVIDDAESRARRARIIERYGVGVGVYSLNHMFSEVELARLDGDHRRGVSLCGQSIRETPLQHLYLTVNEVKLLAFLLADAGKDEQAEELRSGVHAVYRARTGAEHGDLLPQFAPIFDASAARLGERLTEVRARGEALSYDELVDRALDYADQFGSTAGGEQRAQLAQGRLGAGSVGAVDAHD